MKRQITGVHAADIDYSSHAIANTGPALDKLHELFGDKIGFVGVDNTGATPSFAKGMDAIRDLADSRRNDEVREEQLAHAQQLHKEGKFPERLLELIRPQGGAGENRSQHGGEHQSPAPGSLAGGGSERQDQTARTTAEAENLPGVSKPPRQGGNPPATIPAEGNGESPQGGHTPPCARPADRERLERIGGQPGGGHAPKRSGGSGTASHPAAEREGAEGRGERETGADGLPVGSPALELLKTIQVETFVTQLADWAEKDRSALLCQLNSYLGQKEGAA